MEKLLGILFHPDTETPHLNREKAWSPAIWNVNKCGVSVSGWKSYVIGSRPTWRFRIPMNRVGGSGLPMLISTAVDPIILKVFEKPLLLQLQTPLEYDVAFLVRVAAVDLSAFVHQRSFDLIWCLVGLHGDLRATDGL